MDEQAPITAYHGSPHDFEQFDTSKIGTGEGAQSYGHGLYFAEHEPVAKQYREFLSSRQNDLTDPANLAASMVYRTPDGTRESGIAELQTLIKSIDRFPAQYKHDPTARDVAVKALEHLQSSKDLPPQGGHMYEVHINAHPHHMLDWDKPLSEQSPHIVKSIFDARKDNPTLFNVFKPHLEKDSTGMGFYQSLATHHPNGYQGASDFLQRAGIHGIRYLDAGSRNAQGDPTHNYVVFDHNRVSIKRKYEQGGYVEGYGDGGHIPVGDPRRDENLTAFQKNNHPDVPHVVFHGTKIKNIDQFHGQPNWFAEDPYKAGRYARGLKPNHGDSIYPAHISLRKPLHIHDFDMNDKAEDALPLAKKLGLSPNYVEDMGKNHQFAFEIVNHPHFVEAAMQKGFDGIIANEGGYKTFGTFLPNQIKSSIGNNGNFDPANPDITKAEGGYVRTAYKKGGKVEGSIWHEKDAYGVAHGGSIAKTLQHVHNPAIVEHVLNKVGAALPALDPSLMAAKAGRRY